MRAAPLLAMLALTVVAPASTGIPLITQLGSQDGAANRVVEQGSQQEERRETVERREQQKEIAEQAQGEEGAHTPGGVKTPAQPVPNVLYLRFDEADIEGTRVRATNVRMTYGEYEIEGERLEGDIESDLVFTGNPALTYRGQTLFGDAVRFNTKLKSYRIENLRTALTPEFLQNRVVSPLYLAGGSITGRHQEPILGTDSTATSCDRPRPHYAIEAGSIELEPGKRLILRRAAVAWQGRRLAVLPTVIVPLDRRLPRGGYQPSVGRSQEEGWFVKTGFNYMLSERAPGMYRVDLMERKGLGLGIEQAWRMPRSTGEATVYGIPLGGQGSNLSARARSRFLLGAGNELELGYDLRRNDYRTLPDSSDEGIRLGYSLRGGSLDTQLNLNRRTNRSGAYRSDSTTAGLSERITLSTRASILLNADYSRYASGSTAAGGTTTHVTELLNTRLQADYRAENYTLELAANKNIPIGERSGQSYFGSVERLPEIALTRFRFAKGTLANLPLFFNLSAGRFSEGSSTGTGTTRTVTERVTAGFDFGSQRYAPSRRTDLDVSAGFTQYFYGEGAAQFILRSNASFVQRWGGKSGLAVRYAYSQPHGGTPFRFDRQAKFHTLTADMGMLDDARLQLTARVGYDLAGSDYAGYRQPWQTLSANLYVRPVNWLRLRNLFNYDPNRGEFVSITSDLRIRGRQHFALDLVSRYDPRTHRFGQVNAYLDLPVLPRWRAIVLTQYNGYLNRFESRNLQIIHDMHCLEAVLTFIDNPYGWRADRQVVFQIRIKAFPAFQQFGTGMYGQALDTSVGERF